MKYNKKKIQSFFVHQHDQSDCGVACLQSLIRFYGGDAKLEFLRELSGTAKTGTTVLGLYQVGKKTGFEVEGFEGNIDYLKTIANPVILHVLIDERLQHFIICYGFDNDKFIISDPAKGIEFISPKNLEKIWQSKALLTFRPNQHFVKQKLQNKAKRKWFVELVKKDYNLLGISLFLGIVIAFLGMAMAIFSQKLIDNILPEKKIESLVYGLFLISFILIIRSFFIYTRGKFGIVQSRLFNVRLINRFYSNLLKLPLAFFEHRKVGELVARMNDTERIQRAIIFIVSDLAISFLIFIASEVIIFSYSIRIGLISLGVIPIYISLALLYHRKIVSKQKEVMAAHAKNESNYINTIQGVYAIKSDNREIFFSKINKNIYGFYQETIYKLGIISINLNLLLEIIGTVILVFIVSWCSFLVIDDLMKVGELIAILQIVGGLIPAVTTLVFANIQLQGAKVAFNRMYEFASMEPEILTKDENNIALADIKKLELTNISFRFPGRKQILKDVSLKLEKGKIITILGESGCGKTTLIKILQKYYKPESGAIMLNDFEINKVSTKSWRELVGAVPQEVHIFNGNLIDNIAISENPENAKNVLSFCQEFGFHPYFMDFPQNYATLLGEEGVNISGGQKQLVALARALYKKPRILFLDEPSSALDRKTELMIVDLLVKIKKTTAILITTHRIKLAKIADLICLLEDGSITVTGTHKELIKFENFYSQSYFDMTS